MELDCIDGILRDPEVREDQISVDPDVNEVPVRIHCELELVPLTFLQIVK